MYRFFLALTCVKTNATIKHSSKNCSVEVFFLSQILHNEFHMQLHKVRSTGVKLTNSWNWLSWKKSLGSTEATTERKARQRIDQILHFLAVLPCGPWVDRIVRQSGSSRSASIQLKRNGWGSLVTRTFWRMCDFGFAASDSHLRAKVAWTSFLCVSTHLLNWADDCTAEYNCRQWCYGRYDLWLGFSLSGLTCEKNDDEVWAGIIIWQAGARVYPWLCF